MIAKVERVLATLAALLVFTLHELQMFNSRPRLPEGGFMHAAWVRASGAPEQVYMSLADLAARWSLVALVVMLALWALADTLPRAKPAAQRSR